MKKATAVLAMVVISLVAACAPATPTPTPTPQPAPTPVEVLATKPEHLEGIWVMQWVGLQGIQRYERFEADGTVSHERTRDLVEEHPIFDGRFWFEDGVYYEESQACDPIGSYRAYLEIEGGTAVGLRFEVVDDWDPSCQERRYRRQTKWTRVDR